ncbi:hypothetical protein BBB56_06785 [Candidatus Pantoea deserta]|uniref:DUF4354 family protein n=1 Tax=Candidatus Pantoea deserta TaxID=1869313 RepID=A0A3N4PEZ6_9GAMM|nr:hypothetical protein [Pantoea deserta]RPE03097.1 hypothetical protein BBB56_06785 [Pantoea deserta]
MKRNLLKFVSMATLVISCSAQADWAAQVEDDIFSGGKQAMLLGTIADANGVTFDCTHDTLSMAYIEKGSLSSESSVPVTMIVKVDNNAPVRFEGAFSKRNEEYLQASTSVGDIKKVLSQLKQAKSKMLVGLSFDAVNKKMSFTADVEGSTKAVNEFAKACELNI